MPSGSCFRARCGLYISRFDAIMSARTGWGRGEANKFEIPTVVNGFSNGRGGEREKACELGRPEATIMRI